MRLIIELDLGDGNYADVVNSVGQLTEFARDEITGLLGGFGDVVNIIIYREGD